MKKTTEYIKVMLNDGRVQKRTIYVNEQGEKFVYNQRGFWKLEEFAKKRNTK